MTNYTVRIELHHADEGDYAMLHDEMENRGFVRWIIGKHGKRRECHKHCEKPHS